WRTTDNDYRQTLGGPGCQPLTLAEIGELEKTYQVIMVEYVEWKRAYDTLAEALTEITGQEVTLEELPGLIKKSIGSNNDTKK
ncbi:MAG: hypothetical protein IMZ61_07125, partial [Planctomycetes bacterium]|nr:hypothetical protein [Planctomycetota bacterium]